MRLHSRTNLSAAILAVLLASAGIASGHPHVWIGAEVEILTGPAQDVVGFRQKWTFDEMYSAFAVDGLDANGDGVYSREELQPLAQTNIESLKVFEYFTFAFLGKDKLPLQDPAPGYWLEYKDKILTLYFTMPLATPVPREKFKEFSLAVYDPSMFIALTLNKETPVRIVSATPLACAAKTGSRPSGKDPAAAQLGENIDPASNLGLQFAERIMIDCK